MSSLGSARVFGWSSVNGLAKVCGGMVCSAVICCTHSTLSSWGVSVRLSVRSSCRCRLTHRQASAPDCRRAVHLSAPRLDITAVKWPKSCPARWPLPSPTTTRAFAVASLARQFRAVGCIDLFAAALLKTSCAVGVRTLLIPLLLEVGAGRLGCVSVVLRLSPLWLSDRDNCDVRTMSHHVSQTKA